MHMSLYSLAYFALLASSSDAFVTPNVMPLRGAHCSRITSVLYSRARLVTTAKLAEGETSTPPKLDAEQVTKRYVLEAGIFTAF